MNTAYKMIFAVKVLLSTIAILAMGAMLLFAPHAFAQSEPITVEVPSTFSLTVNQVAKVLGTNGVEITLKSSVTNYINEAVLFSVSSPGGCGENADSRCLGMPAFSRDYTLAEGGDVSTFGLNITIVGIASESVAFAISEFSANDPLPRPIEIDPINKGTSNGNPNSDGNSVNDDVTESGPITKCNYEGCNSTEPNCPADCNSEYCSIIDCPTIQPIVCGNGVCDASANNYNCPGSDCLDIELLTVLPASVSSILTASELVRSFQIEIIESIELQQEETKPVYRVKATRPAKFLFFIPIQMSVTVTVDAIEGSVSEVENPWWSFLVR